MCGNISSAADITGTGAEGVTSARNVVGRSFPSRMSSSTNIITEYSICKAGGIITKLRLEFV